MTPDLTSDNPWHVLGIAPTASKEEVKKMYRTLAKRYHPDANQGCAEAEENFKRVQDAFDRITHPEKRRRVRPATSNAYAPPRSAPNPPPREMFVWMSSKTPDREDFTKSIEALKRFGRVWVERTGSEHRLGFQANWLDETDALFVEKIIRLTEIKIEFTKDKTDSQRRYEEAQARARDYERQAREWDALANQQKKSFRFVLMVFAVGAALMISTVAYATGVALWAVAVFCLLWSVAWLPLTAKLANKMFSE